MVLCVAAVLRRAFHRTLVAIGEARQGVEERGEAVHIGAAPLADGALPALVHRDDPALSAPRYRARLMV